MSTTTDVLITGNQTAMTPKRKRTATIVPKLDTIITSDALDTDPESPRTEVAENLLKLAINDNLQSPSGIPSEAHVSKKRQLQDGGSADLYMDTPLSTAEAEDNARAIATPPKEPSPIPTMSPKLEIGETPGAYTSFANRFPSSPPISPSPGSPRPSSEQGIVDSEAEEELDATNILGDRRRGRFDTWRRNSAYRGSGHTSAGRFSNSATDATQLASIKAFRQEHKQERERVQHRRQVKCAPTPITAPPPPTPLTSPGEEPTTQPLLATAAARVLTGPTLLLPTPEQSIMLPSSPKKRRKSPPLAPTSAPRVSLFETPTSPADFSMTWQDSEITGHLWNPAEDKDDDGEGVNGIGFRPSAAMEWKRKEGRKRQVSEWRAREAKEERKRRFERRKRGSGGSGSSNSSLKTTRDARAVDGTDHGEEERGQEGKRARVRFAELS